jgi:hypothetical protein
LLEFLSGVCPKAMNVSNGTAASLFRGKAPSTWRSDFKGFGDSP